MRRRPILERPWSGRAHCLAAALLLALATVPCHAAGARSLAPLGDSITQGSYDDWSYRYRLWQKLIDHGVPFDLVGSMDSHFYGNPAWPDYQGQAFDPDHEGHWGWEANEIIAGRPGEGSLASWLASYTPDIVLLHLGTNDALNGHSTASTVAELETVIGMLQADNPQVTVLLARLIPSSDPAGDAIPPLNAEMDGIAAAMTNALSSVVVVDHHEGFTAATDLSDPWHPNQAGEEKMAEKWFQALAAGPLADPRLRWDASGTVLLWDLAPEAEGSRLYEGDIAALAEVDAQGVPVTGYGSCLAQQSSAVTSLPAARQPQAGQVLFYLLEVESRGRAWGLGRSSSGARREPQAACS